MSFQDIHELEDLSTNFASSDFEDRLRSNVKEIYENVLSLEEQARRLSQRVISQRIVTSVSTLLRRTTALIAETSGIFKQWASTVMSDGGQAALKQEFAFEKLVAHFRSQVTRFQKVEEVVDQFLTQYHKEKGVKNRGKRAGDSNDDGLLLSSPDTAQEDNESGGSNNRQHQQPQSEHVSPYTSNSNRRTKNDTAQTPNYAGKLSSPNTYQRDKSHLHLDVTGRSPRSDVGGRERELVRVPVPSPISNTSETKSLRRFIDHSDSGSDDDKKRSAKTENSRRSDWNDVTHDIGGGSAAPGFSLLDGNLGESPARGAGGFAEGGIDAAATALDFKIHEQGRHRNRSRRNRRGERETRETNQQNMRMRRPNDRTRDSSEGSDSATSENEDWRNNSAEPRDAHGLKGRNRGRPDVSALSEERHDMNSDEQALLLTVNDTTESPLARQIADDRTRGVKRIAQQVSQVNTIFRELAHLVVNQDAPLQTIDDSMKSSLQQARGTVKEVDKAAKYQAKARKRCLVIVVVLGIAAFFFFYVMSVSSSPTIRSQHFSHRKT